MQDVNDPDTFNIFVATDNHLGFKEMDPVRGNDSFNTMEEILKLASDYDMLLLGGDLFHENKPSRHCVYRTLSMFRKYCLCDKCINFNVVSDPSVTFKSQKDVNFRDPNYAVGLPVFIIHGNHDDPIRDGTQTALSALDIMQASNLLNYFGTTETLNQIDIHPILMTKGRTKIALYGLGNVGDERLNRLFAAGKVIFHKPPNMDDYFKICVMHQNRENTGRGPRNCVKDEMIPSFIELTIWGHEHDNQGMPVRRTSDGQGFNVQPGSSVATSLTEGESRPKGVALLQVKRRKMCWTPIPLRTVRPFLYKDVELCNYFENANDPDLEQAVEGFIKDTVTQELERLARQPRTNDLLPLVRLRIDATDFKNLTIQPHRLGVAFKDQVANPEDIILVRRRKATRAPKKDDYPDVTDALRKGQGDHGGEFDQEGLNAIILSSFRGDGQKLSLLLEHSLTDAMQEFANKEAKNAIRENVSSRLKTIQSKLYGDKELNINEIDAVIAEKTDEDRRVAEAQAQQVLAAATQSRPTPQTTTTPTDVAGLSDSDDSDAGVNEMLGRNRPQNESRSRGTNNARAASARTRNSSTNNARVAPARTRHKPVPSTRQGAKSASSTTKTSQSSRSTTKTIESFMQRPKRKANAVGGQAKRAAQHGSEDDIDERISLRESDLDGDGDSSGSDDTRAASQSSTAVARGSATQTSVRSRRQQSGTALSQASTVGIRDTPGRVESDDDTASRGSRVSRRSRRVRAAAARRGKTNAVPDSDSDDFEDSDDDHSTALSLSSASTVTARTTTSTVSNVSSRKVSNVESDVIDLSLMDSENDDVYHPPQPAPVRRSTRRRRR